MTHRRQCQCCECLSSALEPTPASLALSNGSELTVGSIEFDGDVPTPDGFQANITFRYTTVNIGAWDGNYNWTPPEQEHSSCEVKLWISENIHLRFDVDWVRLIEADPLGRTSPAFIMDLVRDDEVLASIIPTPVEGELTQDIVMLTADIGVRVCYMDGVLSGSVNVSAGWSHIIPPIWGS